MRFVALATAMAIIVVAASAFLRDTTGPDKVLLVTATDRTDPQLEETISGFVTWGYYVTERPDAALRASRSEELTVFMVTRRAFDAVPDATWADLYGRHVIVGGLNVSLHELQPLTEGTAAGASRLRHTDQRAIFSMLYTSSGCGTGATSDWLNPYNVAGMADMRAEQIQPCASK